MPEGMGFWDNKAGTQRIDIIPFIAKKGNPYAEEGELHYERTFYTYWKLGADEKPYVCSSKTFGHKDFVREYRIKESKNPEADGTYLKSLEPKERQIFLIYDRAEPDKGLQVWENSFHTFGKLLDSRIDNASEDLGWDFFYLLDDDGMTLRITIEEETQPFKFKKATAIDFIKRSEPVPKEIAEHGICLDDLLVELPYEKLKSIFLNIQPDDTEPETETDEKSIQHDTEAATETEASVTEEVDKAFGAEKTATPTANQYGIEKNDAVIYKGGLYTVVRISGDGTSLTLMNEGDDIVKGISPKSVQLNNESSEPKQESKKSSDSTENSGGDDWDRDWDD